MARFHDKVTNISRYRLRLGLGFRWWWLCLYALGYYLVTAIFKFFDNLNL
jgi:hypothetical protein